MKKWKKLNSKVIFEHPRLTLAEDEVELPNGLKTNYLIFKDSKDFVSVIGIIDPNRYLLIKELAYPINEVLVQFSTGEIENNESPEIAARRELLEETGYKADKIEIIGSFLGNYRRGTYKGHVALAYNLKKIKDPEGDAEEQGIQSIILSDNAIKEKIANGEIIQSNTLCAWSIFQAFKQKSF